MRKNSNVALLSCLTILLSTSAFAYEASRTCQAKDGNGKSYDYLKITYEDTNIRDLFINGYQVISASTQLKDGDIGHDVFSVNVGKMVKLPNGTMELSVGLQDYSDIQSWKITLSEDSNEAAVVSTFKSSDGDDLTHVSSVELTCE